MPVVSTSGTVPGTTRVPCAFPDGATRGRRYPEPRHPFRGDFQRDRDRIIHARAFRRLENKTQVFGPRYSDHFRNRLTHTLEVAQISRTVAQAVGLNSELVETLALAHDIGHPPFGHAGEKALDRAMLGFGERFDHNLHALRIVEEFESRYIAFPGLNLTFEVREGLVKHSHPYAALEHPELAEYELDLHPPVEVQIMDLTDEIAYLAADLDDGYAAGLIGLDALAEGSPLMAGFLADLDRQAPAAPLKLRFNEAIKALLNYFVTSLVEGLNAELPAFATVDAVRHHAVPVALLPVAVDAQRRELKEFLYQALYRHPQLVAENRRADALVSGVFEHLLAHPEALPDGSRQRLGAVPLHRVVCDYLAGMTDGYISAIADGFAS